MARRALHRQALSVLREELAPYPGRLSGSLRDTLGLVLAIVLAMTLRVPGISLSAALLLLMQRERPGLTLRVGLQILAGGAASAAACLLWVQWTDGSEVGRFLGVMFGIFLSAFCMAGTTMPLFWTIFGFYGFVDMAYWDLHHSATAGVTYILNLLASLALVTVCGVAVEYLFGTHHPAEEFDREMHRRIDILKRFFNELANDAPRQQPEEFRATHQELLNIAHAGDIRLNELYDRLRASSRSLAEVPVGLHYRIGLLTRALSRSVVLGFPSFREQEDGAHRSAYREIALLCEQIETAKPHPPTKLPPSEPALLRDIYMELQQYSEMQHIAHGLQTPEGSRTPKAFRPRIFQPGVFQGPETVLYALKMTLAVMVCYILYNAVAWPGILTCVVTVLFTGLTSTGAMKQKQLYRFSGAAIGGALGIATVALLFPNMDSITSLVVVLVPITLLSGWVMRSPRIGYVGVQIGFAFFLTTLPGFSPATQLTPARDRVIGVALGIGVLWFIFDQLWPVRTSDALQRILAQIQSATRQLHDLLHRERSHADMGADFERLRASVTMELMNVQQLDFAAKFEIGRHRKRELASSRRLLQQIEAASAQFYAEAARIPH